jgi:hypothetical protein
VPHFSDLNTAAGFSFPGESKRDKLLELLNIGRTLNHTWKSGQKKQHLPCKLALRGHLSSLENPKTRAVWMYPTEYVMQEMYLFSELVRSLQKVDDDNFKLIHFGKNSMPLLC